MADAVLWLSLATSCRTSLLLWLAAVIKHIDMRCCATAHRSSSVSQSHACCCKAVYATRVARAAAAATATPWPHNRARPRSLSHATPWRRRCCLARCRCMSRGVHAAAACYQQLSLFSATCCRRAAVIMPLRAQQAARAARPAPAHACSPKSRRDECCAPRLVRPRDACGAWCVSICPLTAAITLPGNGAVAHRPVGSLHLIIGPMFAGKTTELLKLLQEKEARSFTCGANHSACVRAF